MSQELPKYIQELNRIIEHLNEQPEKAWKSTQKELAEELDIAQPVMSQRVKTLLEQGRIKYGDPLPRRGKNFVLELVDPTPFEARIVTRDPRDRGFPQQEIPEALEFTKFSPEMIGHAVVETLQGYWERQEERERILEQQEIAVRALRERLEEEHWRAEKLGDEKEELEEQLQEARLLAERLNSRIVSVMKQRTRPEHSGRIVDLDRLDEESESVLRVLMAQ